MTAATITRTPPAASPLELLELWAEGACPPGFCVHCVRVIEDRCDTCARLEYIFAILNAAIGQVRKVTDEAAAREIFGKTVARLTGAEARS